MKEDCSQQRPAVCVPLSPEHVRPRLHWAREHRSWTPEQWGHVLFTDESRFNIQNDSRRPMIWIHVHPFDTIGNETRQTRQRVSSHQQFNGSIVGPRRGVKLYAVQSTSVHKWAFGSESPY
ncbi:hypothetical protein AVEN_57578-1 [Araneus ventricosus]|uniref:Transposase Tc1-like domain-containing protein n=1 Tax=Araneus ventricosus TaxID=182803 RepID=A0A4Y2P4T0_ARAVE|nr:hypothetical protein AVEN_57578-1 [Araneus ventricosus]